MTSIPGLSWSRNMRRIVLTALVLLTTYAESFSQIVVSGTVRYSGNGAAVDLANVMIEDPGTKTVIGFATTGKDGCFSISCNTKSGTLTVTVAGFNVERTSQTIKAQSQKLDIDVGYREMKLQAAVVRTKPIRRMGDTLTYYVGMFSDSLDRSIGDVIRKMPGITVDKAGGIKYNGKVINRFYIEGLDLMGSRYGVATNSIRAKDVAAVEVYENHQPVKMFRNLTLSGNLPENAAINLKLKNKSKGAIIGTMQLGAGYGPLMWDGAVTAMLFTNSYQMLCTVKSNNSGHDIVSELAEQYDNTARLSPYIGVYAPKTPDIDMERYMDNTTHAVSVNNLFKLDEDDILSINGIYCYDRQTFNDSSMTVYYMPSTDPLTISEATSATRKKNYAEMRLKFTGNASKRYTDEALTLSAGWNDTQGTVLTGDDLVSQGFDMAPNLSLKNEFSSFKKVKDGVDFGVNSTVSAGSLPASLEVTPALYPSIFGYGQAEDGTVLQTMANRSFHTGNYVSFIGDMARGLSLYASLGFTADIQKMESSLGLASLTERVDSLRNDIGYGRWDIDGHVELSYRYRKLDLSASAYMDYAFFNVHDNIINTLTSKSRPFFSSFLDMDLKLALNLKLNVRSSYTEDYGSITDMYSGYIMTDYRSIASRSGAIGENKKLNCSVSLKYADALSALFASLDASYWRTGSNLMYGTTFDGTLSRIESYAIDNVSQGYGVSGRVSKYFDGILTTMELSGGYRRLLMDILRQGTVMKTSTGLASAGFKAITSWGKRVRTRYDASFENIGTEYIGGSTPVSPINALHQKLSLDCSIMPGLVLNIAGEHYFNSAIISGSRHVPFLDASLTYRTGEVEYLLEARNLLDTRTYDNRLTSDATEFEYRYLLRPASVMLKVRFSLN